MKLVNDPAVKCDAFFYHAGKRYRIRASQVRKSVIQSGQKPHALDVKTGCQRKPQKLVESKLCVSFKFLSHPVALFHQGIDLIKKIERLIVVKSVIDAVIHGFCAAGGGDAGVTLEHLADSAPVGLRDIRTEDAVDYKLCVFCGRIGICCSPAVEIVCEIQEE